MTYESSDLVFSISGIKKNRFFSVAGSRPKEIIYKYIYNQFEKDPTLLDLDR